MANYNRDGFEWTFDFTPDAEGLATLKAQGLASKIKNKGDERGDFIQLKQKEKTVAGKLNDPITVCDAKNRLWNPDIKIGNGSTAEVKIDIVDYGKGKPTGVYPRAIRVLDLVQYVRQEFAPLPEDNEFVRKADEFNPVVDEDVQMDMAELDEDPLGIDEE